MAAAALGSPFAEAVRLVALVKAGGFLAYLLIRLLITTALQRRDLDAIKLKTTSFDFKVYSKYAFRGVDPEETEACESLKVLLW